MVACQSNSSPTKVMYIISGDIYAGAEVQVFNTLSALYREDSCELICIIFNNGTLKKQLESIRIRTLVLDETQLSSFSLILKLKKILKDSSPDILHVHAVKEHFLAIIASIMAKSGTPIVRTVHGQRGVPKNVPILQNLRSHIVVMLDNFLIRRLTDSIIAVSQDIMNELAALRSRGKLYQIYNAVDIKRYKLMHSDEELRTKYKVMNCFWIGTAARLVPIKNLQMLVEAGRILHQKNVSFRMSIFGDGPSKSELKRIIQEMGMAERIVLHGFDSEVVSAINSLNVFVLCSLHEGLPMALLEAMALGTPAVCTSVGGIKEVIQNGVDGLLVPSNDSSALAHALLKLFEDRTLADTLANNARKKIENNFTLSKTVGQLLDVYGEVVHRNSKVQG